MSHTVLWGTTRFMILYSMVWSLFSLSHSAFDLAILGASIASGNIIVNVVGGLVTDRFSRKTLVLYPGFATVIAMTLIGVVLVLDVAHPWHFWVAGFIFQMVYSVAWTGRFYMLPNLVQPDILQGALVLDVAAFNVARLIAPVIWGLVVAFTNAHIPFFVIAGLLIANAAVVAMLKPARSHTPGAHDSITEHVKGLFALATTNRLVAGSLLTNLLTAITLGGFLYMVTPFGKTILDLDSSGIASLFTAIGLGTLAGSTFVATFGGLGRSGTALFVAIAGMCGLGIAASFAPGLIIAQVFLFAFAFAEGVHYSISHVVLQFSVSNELRARLGTLYTLVWAGLPIGGLIWAGMSGFTSVTLAMLVAAIAVGVGGLVIVFTLPELRRIELDDDHLHADLADEQGY